jgi:hypothetical protein
MTAQCSTAAIISQSALALVVKDTGNLFILTNPEPAGTVTEVLRGRAVGEMIIVTGQVQPIPSVEDSTGKYLLTVSASAAAPAERSRKS